VGEDPESVYRMNEFREAIADILDPRRYKVLMLRYYGGLTYKDIGKHFGITGVRARQLVCVALRRLRHPDRKLIEYMDMI